VNNDGASSVERIEERSDGDVKRASDQSGNSVVPLPFLRVFLLVLVPACVRRAKKLAQSGEDEANEDRGAWRTRQARYFRLHVEFGSETLLFTEGFGLV
jgi:hypothetical protein